MPTTNPAHDKKHTVGASLLAMADWQVTTMLNVRASSRAGSFTGEIYSHCESDGAAIPPARESYSKNKAEAAA
ncbi:hypothetical protein DOZ80_18035 [Pseudomonas fluorescens]|uniref:Uncharacterized protein n=1 Tax=Pseudomonas fluorescens TaxID=294 RepID=A0A327MZL1_PSEFL|nr:hypothetical protein DOZ80_18035 [Pseudomonas fluorescens]